MKFRISCNTLIRLASVACHNIQPDQPAYLVSIFLENRNGKTIAFATNYNLAVVEIIEQTAEPDGHVCVALDQALINQCYQEQTAGTMVEITTIPEIGAAVIKTGLGWNSPTNAIHHLPADALFLKWRDFIPETLPSKTFGPMFLDANDIQVLFNSSPSRSIVFQEFIDRRVPVIVKDEHDPAWLGIFLVSRSEKGKIKQATPATLPDWAK